MPQVSAGEVGKALARAGFQQVSQKGSHQKWRHADGRSAIVPDHREIAPGTIRSILRQAKLSEEEFARLLAG